MSGPASLRRTGWAGALLLGALWGVSLLVGVLFPSVAERVCPLGPDALQPDHSVCQLAVGGLWISMGVGLVAGALATVLGLAVAVGARVLRGAAERWVMRLADALFTLPDVLVLMVLQFAGQIWADARPGRALGPVWLMIFSLALIGWAGPARIFRNRLETLERQEFVEAARALGGGRLHLFRAHLWPGLRAFVVGVFLSRVPVAILAESTVSFLGVARMEPMSLGRYLGTRSSSLLYEGGARVVLPAWGLLVLVVLGGSLAARGFLGSAERTRGG